MNKNNLVVALVIVAVALSLLSFTGVGKQVVGGVYSSEQTFGGGVKTAYTKFFNGNLITATKTMTTSELANASVFTVGKASETILISLPAVNSDMVGRKVLFLTTVASTVVEMNLSSVMNVVTQSNYSTFSTAEDIGDYIECLFISTSKARCSINAAD